MSISVTCPNCETTLRVKDEAAGKKVRCKECQKVISVPAADGGGGADWDGLPEPPPPPRPRRRGTLRAKTVWAGGALFRRLGRRYPLRSWARACCAGWAPPSGF